MAFAKKYRNKQVIATEQTVLPSSAVQEFSGVFPSYFRPDGKFANRNIFLSVNASAVTGTNLDIALYGSDTESGAVKHLLLDAVVADITATGWVDAIVDLNAYPSAYYFLAWTADVDEDANTIDVKLSAPQDF